MRMPRRFATFLVAAALALAGLAVATPASAATPDKGAIAAKYMSMGGATGYLGAATSPLRCKLLRGGCGQSFRNGKIYWSAATGAHLTRGAIGGRWSNAGSERGPLGYPTTEIKCGLVSTGCVQGFQGGPVYWQASTGAHAAKGAIGNKWKQLGSERSLLGYPKTDEACSGTTMRTCVQKFSGGSITWWKTGKVSVVPSQGSIGVVVNKKRPNSPVNRTPTDLVRVGGQLMRREAAGQMQTLVNAAAKSGVAVTAVSGFRSYASQSILYRSYVAQYGQGTADTISARPGFSEHQTGLVLDIGNPNGACGLNACFANTPAGSYAARNAWKYGFIVRYPNGYTSTTGYAYEPWHLRYIGLKAATDMHNRGVRTLEQYFGLAGAPRY